MEKRVFLSRDQLGYQLAFTKSAREPTIAANMRGREPTLAANELRFIATSQTWPRQTLLVKSKTCGKAVLDTTFGDRGDRNIPLVTLTPAALRMDHRDLTNRVKASFTYLGSETGFMPE